MDALGFTLPSMGGGKNGRTSGKWQRSKKSRNEHWSEPMSREFVVLVCFCMMNFIILLLVVAKQYDMENKDKDS